MIRMLVLYPDEAGKRFDFRYYIDTHMAMVKEHWAKYMDGFEVDKGVAGRTLEAPAPYRVAAHVFFKSMEDCQKALADHMEELVADVANYTDIKPQFQISEIDVSYKAG